VKLVKGLKLVAYSNDEVIVKQRIKFLDDMGNLIRAPIIEVRAEKKHDKEPLEEVRKRAEEVLEQRLKEVERRTLSKPEKAEKAIEEGQGEVSE